mgnify:CR=1 FL=1
MIRTVLLAAASLLICTVPAIAQDAAEPAANQPAVAAPASHIEIHTNPLLSLHMMARAGAAGVEVPATVWPASQAMTAAGPDMRWEVFDAHFATTTSAEGSRELLIAMAPRLGERAGGQVGEHVFAYANAFADAAPKFHAEVWPEHKVRIDAASEGLKAALDAHGPSCIARICEILGIADPRVTTPTFLVTVAPAPGGFSVLSREYYALSIVSIDAHQGSALVEATLHEAIHVLDAHTRQQQPPSVLASLRKALTDAGIQPTDPRFRDIPHTLIFAVAAHITRTSVDASHIPYGQTGGYYAKVPEARDAVLPSFTRYVAGEISSAGLVAEIVKNSTKPE